VALDTVRVSPRTAIPDSGPGSPPDTVLDCAPGTAPDALLDSAKRTAPGNALGSVTGEPAGPAVTFDAVALDEIAAAAAAAYPNEGCGALLGPRAGHVTETFDLPNSEAGAPRVRFAVAPLDYLAVEDAADRRGLSLLGFWHSHPDHPALPSKTDRAYAWVGLLTVIVSVPQRVPGDIKAWEIAAPDADFSSVAIRDLTGRVVVSLRDRAPAPALRHDPSREHDESLPHQPLDRDPRFGRRGKTGRRDPPSRERRRSHRAKET